MEYEPKPEIKVTPHLIHKLWRAQLQCAKEHIDATFQHPGNIGDDSYDYLRASLALATELTEIWYNQDETALWRMLNSPKDDSALSSYACDGIAQAFYELNCRGLDDEEETATTP